MTDRSVKVYLKGDISDFNRAMLAASATSKAFVKELDTGNDRMTNLVQTSLALGPALVPIGAAAIPAIGGLTNQLAFATAGVGAAVLAFGGLGDGLKALNEYQLEPTAANLNKVNEAMAKLGPAGREFAVFLQDLRPELQRLQDSAQAGLFPGLQRGITDLMTLSPQVEQIIFNLTDAFGDLAAEAGANLAGPEWAEFFNFLEREAKPTLTDLGRTLGNLAQGFAQLWMAFDPLSDQFSKGFLQMSRDFNAWATGLDQTEGFQNFLDYVSRVSPKVWETLGAVGNAIVEIVEAAAPVGEATLPVIEALADAIATIADSPLGPTVIALASITATIGRLTALSRAASGGAMGSILGMTAWGGIAKQAKDLPAATRAYMNYGAAMTGVGSSAERMGTSMKAAAKLAGGVGGLAFVMSDLDDKLGLTNTAMGAMVGSVLPGWGTAIGAAVGFTADMAKATDDSAKSLERLKESLNSAGSLHEQGSILAGAREAADAFAEIGVGDEFVQGVADLEKQHRKASEAARDQALAEAGFASALSSASEETKNQTYELLQNVAAKNAARDATQSAFSAETNYRQALKDAREQAKENNAGIDGMSDAALKNRSALDQLASAWDRQAELGASEADFQKARENFIAIATGMGVAREEAEKLADELLNLPSPKPKVDVKGADKAIEALKAIKRALDAINPFKNITVTTKNKTVYDHGPTIDAIGGFHINGVRQYATGGIDERGGYVPRVPQMRSGSQGQVLWSELETGWEAYISGKPGFEDRNRNILKDAAGRLGGVALFADGGFAGAVRADSASPAFGDMTASIEGARFRLDTDGFMTAIDGRIRVGIAAQGSYDKSTQRQHGRR